MEGNMMYSKWCRRVLLASLCAVFDGDAQALAKKLHICKIRLLFYRNSVTIRGRIRLLYKMTILLLFVISSYT